MAQTEEDDVNLDGDFDDTGTDTSERTDYHVDHRNPTGYAQVLEEMHGDMVVKSYTIGHDVFLEAVAANETRRLLKDGHGSTRALVDATGNVIQSGTTAQVFAYDAYGVPIGFTLTDALTTHLYSGEQTDQLTGLQYLRARYYNPSSGTFNRLDPFAGNFSDPQSLHKYAYCHGSPVNGIDPSGKFFTIGAMLVSHAIQGKMRVGYSRTALITGVYATGILTDLVVGHAFAALVASWWKGMPYKAALDGVLAQEPYMLIPEGITPRTPTGIIRHYKDDINSHHAIVPPELLASVLLAELWHYNVLDTFCDHLPWGDEHSIGIAQMRVQTVQQHGIHSGLSASEIEERLLDPRLAIETLALDLKWIANSSFVDLTTWDSLSEYDKALLVAKFTSAKDLIDLPAEYGVITDFGEYFGKDAYVAVKDKNLLD